MVRVDAGPDVYKRVETAHGNGAFQHNMRLIVMSDIHGNLQALEAVVQSLPEHDRVIVAGDHCLDGADPATVVDRLGELTWELVLGNTDRDLVSPPDDLKRRKRDVLDWTRDQLGAERLRFLGNLPFAVEAGDSDLRVLVVHANPVDLEGKMEPTMTELELGPYLSGLENGVLAFGHLHTPYVRPVDGVLLVDVSSVGHPKDRDLRAAYTLIEWEDGRRAVTQYRLPYDVTGAVAALRSCGMPHAEKQVASLLKASY